MKKDVLFDLGFFTSLNFKKFDFFLIKIKTKTFEIILL